MSALRPLADSEWAFRKLTLRAGLCAGDGGTGGEGAGVTGQETKGRNRRNRAEERDDSRTARRTGYREAIHFRSSMSSLIRFGIDSPPDCTMDRLGSAVWGQLQCLVRWPSAVGGLARSRELQESRKTRTRRRSAIGSELSAGPKARPSGFELPASLWTEEKPPHL